MVENNRFINFLQELNFRKVGSWELINCEVNYEIKEETYVSVYLWVAETEDGKIIPLYVGKAGTSLNKRMNEHLNGFKERNSGKKKREVLQTLLEQKINVDIFARESLIFDSKKITELDFLFPNCKYNTPLILSTESLEEMILIQIIKTKFYNNKRPPLNHMSDNTKNELELNYLNYCID
jgi:hypothetical protein